MALAKFTNYSIASELATFRCKIQAVAVHCERNRSKMLSENCGYPVELFLDPNVAKNLTCPICYDIVKDPLQCGQCGNSLCKSCINSWQSKNKHCALCKAVDPSYTPNLMAQAILANMSIRCPSTLTTPAKVCEWSGCLGDVSLHYMECHPEFVDPKQLTTYTLRYISSERRNVNAKFNALMRRIQKDSSIIMSHLLRDAELRSTIIECLVGRDVEKERIGVHESTFFAFLINNEEMRTCLQSHALELIPYWTEVIQTTFSSLKAGSLVWMMKNLVIIIADPTFAKKLVSLPRFMTELTNAFINDAARESDYAQLCAVAESLAKTVPELLLTRENFMLLMDKLLVVIRTSPKVTVKGLTFELIEYLWCFHRSEYDHEYLMLFSSCGLLLNLVDWLVYLKDHPNAAKAVESSELPVLQMIRSLLESGMEEYLLAFHYLHIESVLMECYLGTSCPLKKGPLFDTALEILQILSRYEVCLPEIKKYPLHRIVALLEHNNESAMEIVRNACIHVDYTLYEDEVFLQGVITVMTFCNAQYGLELLTLLFGSKERWKYFPLLSLALSPKSLELLVASLCSFADKYNVDAILSDAQTAVAINTTFLILCGVAIALHGEQHLPIGKYLQSKRLLELYCNYHIDNHTRAVALRLVCDCSEIKLDNDEQYGAFLSSGKAGMLSTYWRSYAEVWSIQLQLVNLESSFPTTQMFFQLVEAQLLLLLSSTTKREELLEIVKDGCEIWNEYFSMYFHTDCCTQYEIATYFTQDSSVLEAFANIPIVVKWFAGWLPMIDRIHTNAKKSGIQYALSFVESVLTVKPSALIAVVMQKLDKVKSVMEKLQASEEFKTAPMEAQEKKAANIVQLLKQL